MKYAVILAGGIGSRFWPYSTKDNPKQFLRIGEKSLIEQSWNRLQTAFDKRLIVTTASQLKLAKKNLAKANYIVEPEGRNTAPAIFLTLAKLVADGAKDNDIVAFFPADHFISGNFNKTLKKGFSLAAKGIVVIGVKPSFPSTAFGYIQKGIKTGLGFTVKHFLEKPKLKTAKKYLKSSNYLWNAGIFIASIASFKRAFEKHAPSFLKEFESLKKTKNASKLKLIYRSLEKISFDYLIMEKLDKSYMVEADFFWNDLGSWDALPSVLPRINENYTLDATSVKTRNASENVIFAPSKQVTLIGVKDLIIVEYNNNLLVVSKKDAQMVKDFAKS